MAIPAQRYFRILVVGSQNATVAEIIERELNFRTLVIESSAIAGTLRNSADLGAIVVSTEPGERYAAAAAPMIDYFLVFEEACNRFSGFSYEVQGVYQQGVIVTMVSNVRARIAAARARHRRHTRPLMTAWES
jgi:nucleoside phosphorylase